MPINQIIQPRIGIDLGGTKTEGVILDERGEIVVRHRVPTPKNNFEATIKTIMQLVAKLETGFETSGTAPVGICTPGSISPISGVMRNSNSTGLNDKPLQEILIERLARPVKLANDADCFALSEATALFALMMSFLILFAF